MPTIKEEIKLYGGTVAITFYPTSHKYKKAGDKGYLTSVTSVTGVIDKSPFLIPWAVGLTANYLRAFTETVEGELVHKLALETAIDEASRQHTIKKEEAGDKGSQVHAFAEAFTHAVLTRSAPPSVETDDEDVKRGINAFLSWVTQNHVQFVAPELLVYSRKHDYCGILDAVAVVNGKKYIIDYKTSKRIYTEYLLQVAGYGIAYEEEHGAVDGYIILRFDKETGELEQRVLDKKADIKEAKTTFLSALKLKQWLKANP